MNLNEVVEVSDELEPLLTLQKSTTLVNRVHHTPVSTEVDEEIQVEHPPAKRAEPSITKAQLATPALEKPTEPVLEKPAK